MKFQIIFHYGEDEEFFVDNDHGATPLVGETVELWQPGTPMVSPRKLFEGVVTRRDWEYSERITGCHIYFNQVG